jgi:hypothetical protein
MLKQEEIFLVETLPLQSIVAENLPSSPSQVLGLKRPAESPLGMFDCEDLLPSASFGFESFESVFGLDPYGLGPQIIPSSLPNASAEEQLETAFEYFDLPKAVQPVEPSLFSVETKPFPQQTNSKNSRRTTPSLTASSVCDESISLATKRERNRLAAERCRQKKTALIETLQQECDQLRAEKEKLLEENRKLLQALGLRF